jgi:DNA-binding Lrp family transcriptional regulator
LVTGQRTIDSVHKVAAEEGIVKACVLIRVRPGQHYLVAKEIASFEGVKSAFAVVGNADVVASIEVPSMRALAALGTKIGNLAGVVISETLVTAEA